MSNPHSCGHGCPVMGCGVVYYGLAAMTGNELTIRKVAKPLLVLSRLPFPGCLTRVRVVQLATVVSSLFLCVMVAWSCLGNCVCGMSWANSP